MTPRFFESAGIPIVLGRDFRDSDALGRASGPTGSAASSGRRKSLAPPGRLALRLSTTFVRKFLAGRSPIGMRLSMGEKWREDRTHEIVGVVRDARYSI